MINNRNAFHILGEAIEPGKGARLNLEVAKLHTNTPIQVPVIVQHAKKDGPVLLLLAGSHGDEVNGTEIVRQIIKKGWNKPAFGTVICIPVFNIFAFLNFTREFPDGRDLNRSFPGTKNGSLASQFAYHFMKDIATNVDVIIDFHTGAVQRNNFPQTRCDFKEKRSLELCEIFGAPIVLRSPLIAKTLRSAMQKEGREYVLFEGGKANRLDENVISIGIKGVQRVMKHLGMRDFKVTAPDDSLIYLHESSWLRAPNSGMLRLKVKNGAFVTKGTILASVSDPYGNFERSVKSPRDGYIFCVNETPIVTKGDAIFHLGQEKNL
ncbi:MAG: succinylglutamate desuccinylase/aspartoacylase family protein [Crocinitomicaceae bacterium]|nr:succinylglutamate desuccinylase/aspartoacylase family protein [Crocinitomicaceae bacterium]